VKVAIFGGSFNPPHIAHLMVAEWILATGRADELWIVPTASHPFGKELAPFEDRFEMTRAMASLLGPKAKVLDLEAKRAGTSYTIDTVEELRRENPGVRFALVVGTDVLIESPKWKEWDRLQTLVELLPVRRSGVAGAEPDPDPEHPTPLFPDVRSTDIRARLARGEPVDGLVPAAVLARIGARGMYR
jgi:nicotinate-nucleotide adenylyltransferase